MEAMDCGPASLKMIAKYYGKSYTMQTLRERCFITREGVSMQGISDAAERIGFRTLGVRLTFEQLANETLLPCILHWNQNHFVVCYKIKRKKSSDARIYIADPDSIYKSIDLKEVTISASNLLHHGDKDIWLVTDEMRKNTFDTFSLIGKIPGMYYDKKLKSLLYNNRENVLLLIDGKEKTNGMV